jgi:hypothetical protein
MAFISIKANEHREPRLGLYWRDGRLPNVQLNVREQS